MSAKIWKMTGTETVEREVENFDLLDRWLRWVGYDIDVRKVSWEEAETTSLWTRDEPTPFVAFSWNTRDENHHVSAGLLFTAHCLLIISDLFFFFPFFNS